MEETAGWDCEETRDEGKVMGGGREDVVECRARARVVHVRRSSVGGSGAGFDPGSGERGEDEAEGTCWRGRRRRPASASARAGRRLRLRLRLGAIGAIGGWMLGGCEVGPRVETMSGRSEGGIRLTDGGSHGRSLGVESKEGG